MNRELMKKYAQNWAYFWLLPERRSADIWEEARARIVELAPHYRGINILPSALTGADCLLGQGTHRPRRRVVFLGLREELPS